MPPPNTEKQPKPKTRIAVQLKESMGVSKARNRSADLVKLQEQFFGFVKTIKALIVVLKQHHGSMMSLQKTRLAVSREALGQVKSN